jgi:hypothetical protein
MGSGSQQPAGRGGSSDANEEAIAFGRKVGLGCFTFIVGMFSGGMVAVFIGKVVEELRKSPSCDGVPICNWYLYAGIGALVGAATLPALVLWRLRKPAAPATRERG